MPTFVVVPVKGRLDLTRSLVGQLARDAYDAIFVLDNGSRDETWNWLCSCPKSLALQAVDATDLGIYAMWNLGIRLARERSPVCNVAILNNDIRLGIHFLDHLAVGLRSSPALWAVSANYDGRRIEGVEYVQASFKSGGFAGFAFMTRGEIFDAVSFDEEFRWWYGDDDFLAQIEQSGGRVGIVGSATVEHVNGGGQTAQYTREMLITIERDRRRMWSKWHHF